MIIVNQYRIRNANKAMKTSSEITGTFSEQFFFQTVARNR